MTKTLNYLRWLLLTVLCNNFNSEASIITINSNGTLGANQFISAINFFNANTGIDTIFFNISGGGPHVLPFTALLPEITDGLIIDGFSQPGNDTINWTIQLSGNVSFTIRTGVFTIRGIRMINTQPQNTYPRAFYIQNTVSQNSFNITSLVFDKNYIENYYQLYSYNITGTGIYPTVGNLHITGNRLYNNYYGLRTPGSWFNVVYSDFVISGNYVVNNNYSKINGNPQATPHNFLVENNYFYNSLLQISETILKTALITGNNFQGNSYLDFEVSPDSVVIDDNYFGNGTHGIVVFLSDTLGKRLYITNNKLYCKTNRALLLDVGGASGFHYAEKIYIKNNDVIGEGIVVRVGITSGNARLSKCEIANNTITYDTIGFVGSLLDMELSSTGGTVAADSIDIHDNFIDGLGINYSHNGTSSGNWYGERIYIRRNTVINSTNTAGIRFDINKNTLRKCFIDSNTVSLSRTGILISSQVFSGYSAAIKQMHITRNTLMLNDSVGIAIMSQPWNGHLNIDSVYINGNNIYANDYDGIRMWTTMEAPGYTNKFSNIYIANNTITNNTGYGILFENYGSATGNYASPVLHHLTYSKNSIFNNTLLGIKINNLNDPGFPVSPMFPVPVITSITTLSGNFEVNGYINGAPDTNYVIELFSNLSPDPSGFGEGETFIADSTILTNSNGAGYFNINVQGTPGNMFYSATATQVNSGNTSEFSMAADATVGLNEDEHLDFTIYPNPSKGTFNIHGLKPGSRYTVVLTDLSGRVYNEFLDFSGEQVSVSSKSGAYFISVNKDGDVIWRTKLIVIFE